jgi:hypothetical protein
MDGVVAEASARRVHRAPRKDDAVGFPLTRLKDGELLRDTTLDARRGKAHLEHSSIAGVLLLIGVDHRLDVRPRREEISVVHAALLSL